MTLPDLTSTQRQDLATLRKWVTPLDAAHWVHKELVESYLKRWPVDGKRVLELGPFEGHHTVQMLQAGAASVTCVEPRPLNAIAVYTRALYHGVQDRVRVVLATASTLRTVEPDEFDVLLHLGVLYHMVDPTTHVLRDFPKFENVLLDTHMLLDTRWNSHNAFGHQVSLGEYAGRKYRERGWSHTRAGLDDHSTFLYETSLRRLLGNTGMQVEDLRRAPHELSPRQAFAIYRET